MSLSTFRVRRFALVFAAAIVVLLGVQALRSEIDLAKKDPCRGDHRHGPRVLPAAVARDRCRDNRPVSVGGAAPGRRG